MTPASPGDLRHGGQAVAGERRHYQRQHDGQKPKGEHDVDAVRRQTGPHAAAPCVCNGEERDQPGCPPIRRRTLGSEIQRNDLGVGPNLVEQAECDQQHEQPRAAGSIAIHQQVGQGAVLPAAAYGPDRHPGDDEAQVVNGIANPARQAVAVGESRGVGDRLREHPRDRGAHRHHQHAGRSRVAASTVEELGRADPAGGDAPGHCTEQGENEPWRDLGQHRGEHFRLCGYVPISKMQT